MSASAMSHRPTLKVLAVIEATTVIGPAKNLIEFCRRARALDVPAYALPAVEVTIATFHRGSAASSRAGEDAARDGGAAAVGAVGGSVPNEFVAAARAAGIEVEVIGERFRFDPRVRAQLRRIAARLAPDIIQTHQVKSHFLLKLTGLWRRYPWIAYHHGYTTTDMKMRLYNSLNRWSLPTAHRVVTVCQAFAEQLARAGVAPELIRVRHNSINTNGFTAGQARAARAARAVRHRRGRAHHSRRRAAFAGEGAGRSGRCAGPLTPRAARHQFQALARRRRPGTPAHRAPGRRAGH